jgi:uncharacterized LabA/DUF88 family protein
MASAYMYIDAQYVAKELLDGWKSPWFDPKPLFKYRFHDQTTRPFEVTRIFFYDALWRDDSTDPKEKQKRENQRKYLAEIESIDFVEVRTGFIRAGQNKPREQKGVDVQITVDALVAASNRLVDGVILVSGDADFCPLADAVRRTGTFFFVAGFQGKVPSDLRFAADVVGVLPAPGSWVALASFTPIEG